MENIIHEVNPNLSTYEKIVDFLSEQTSTEENDWSLIFQENNEILFYNTQDKLEAKIVMNDENNYDFFIEKVIIH